MPPALLRFAILWFAACASPASPRPVARPALAAPPASLVREWSLSPIYVKHVDVEGFPIVGSSRPSDFALLEAAYLVRQMIGHRPELLRALAARHVRGVVMATTEMTTDVPEHSDLRPVEYWNRRARGLGPTPIRPAMSGAEENLLALRGDPYSTESIFVHEFAHAVHEMALDAVDPSFGPRLRAAFDHAHGAGLWRGTYAMSNEREYWAEGTQSWFDTNRADDAEHGPIDTRDELRTYDPMLATLLAEVYGDRPWRYVRPDRRASLEHLEGFDRARAPAFVWPAERAPEIVLPEVPRIDPASAPAVSPDSSTAAFLLFTNRRERPVTIEWRSFTGQLVPYGTLAQGESLTQNTFAGHVWIVREGGADIAAYVTPAEAARVEIR
jgi:hypothetical protein